MRPVARRWMRLIEEKLEKQGGGNVISSGFQAMFSVP